MKHKIILQQINEAAVKWNKTKDPKYKTEWYRLIKVYNGGKTSRNPLNVQR